MTGANRVSNLYASVAEAGDSSGDPLPPSGASSQHRVDFAAAHPSADADRLQDMAPPSGGRRADESEQRNARGRALTAAQATSRRTLLRRAALAGVAILLLGVGLIAVEEAPAPVASSGTGASMATVAAESDTGDESAATASTPAAVALASEGGGAEGPPVAAVGLETGAAGASDDAATQPEAGQAGAPRAADPIGAAQDGAAHAAAPHAPTSTSATSQGGTASGGPAQPGTAQAATAPTGAAPAAPAANTEPAPGSAPVSPSDVAKAGSAQHGGTAAPASGPLVNEKQPAAAVPSAGLATPPPGAARALAQGYIVQLGVFGDPDNAAVLSRELAAQGYPAHLQSRVVLGPFPDRQAAKAAAARLRGERKFEGIVVPPRKP